jgi:hypothetical protein
MRNMRIILCINYIIITWIIDNNAVINNDYVRPQDLILVFKIPMCKRKNFFEGCRQSGHALSKRFASPGLGDASEQLQNEISSNLGR